MTTAMLAVCFRRLHPFRRSLGSSQRGWGVIDEKIDLFDYGDLILFSSVGSRVTR